MGTAGPESSNESGRSKLIAEPYALPSTCIVQLRMARVIRSGRTARTMSSAGEGVVINHYASAEPSWEGVRVHGAAVAACAVTVAVAAAATWVTADGGEGGGDGGGGSGR